MDITTLFEQVFGIYLLLAAVYLLTRKHELLSIGNVFGKERALRFSMAAVIMLGGLFMVLAYQNWSTVATSIITIVGWLILLKGVIYFFATDKQVERIMKHMGDGKIFMLWGVVYVLAGGYLTLLGFGII